MASKKLSTVGFSASGGTSLPQAQETSVVDLMTRFNKCVTSGMFDPSVMATLPRDEQLGIWEDFFAIGARADELPAWAVKPSLQERNGAIVPTTAGVSKAAFSMSQDKKELRSAVDLMGSGSGRPVEVQSVRGVTDGKRPMSRSDMVRLAQSSFGSGVFGEVAVPGEDGLSR